MKIKRIYLNLFLIDFPITALTSIIHRISGILIFLFLPFLLYFFYLSVESNSSFIVAKFLFSKIYVKLLFYIFLFSFIYHFVTGVKHIIMDLGFFEDKSSSRNFALFSLFLVFIFIILSLFL